MLTPPKPDRYTGLARYYSVRKKKNEEVRAYKPHRLAEAVQQPLIRYQEWKRGELEDIPFHEEDTFQDPVLFWIHWLNGIKEAASYRLDPVAFEPIRDLTRLLDDLRTGARSKLRGRFVNPQKNSDPPPVAHHKLAVGLCYKLLTEAALCKKKRAIEIIERCLERRGLLIHGQIPDLARKVSKNREGLPFTIRALVKDSGLNEFFTLFIGYLEGAKLYDDYPEFKQMIESCRDLINEGRISLADWENIVEDFGSTNWRKLDEHSRYELINAWGRARVIACRVILKLCSPKEELKRFGYAKEV